MKVNDSYNYWMEGELNYIIELFLFAVDSKNYLLCIKNEFMFSLTFNSYSLMSTLMGCLDNRQLTIRVFNNYQQIINNKIINNIFSQ